MQNEETSLTLHEQMEYCKQKNHCVCVVYTPKTEEIKDAKAF